VVREPRGYRIRLDPGELDLEEFDRRLAAGRETFANGDAATAREELDRGLALWGGPPLKDLVEIEACQPAPHPLAHMRSTAPQRRTAADLQLGRAVDDTADLSAVLEHEPYRESAWALLIRALYQAGRQQEALDAYDRARTRLRDDLGVEPVPELRRLQTQVL